jgi:hypothetical protein
MMPSLPTEVFDSIIRCGLTVQDLCAISAASRSFLGLNDGNWCACVRMIWGRHLHLPPDVSTWQQAAAHLHTCVRPTLRRSVAKAIRLLESNGYFGPLGGDIDVAQIACLRSFLDSGDMEKRRRVAAYVCSGKHKTSFIEHFLEDVDWLRNNKFVRFTESALRVEYAFRRLLLKFPFLPIDAGVGADRVINAFTQVLLKNAPEAPQQRRRRQRHSSWSETPCECDEAKSSQQCSTTTNTLDDEGHDVPGKNNINFASEEITKQIQTMPCLIPEISPDKQRDAVYILVYSLIMLNTDLHNPAIYPKIKAEEFVRSCKQTILRDIPESMLVQMFHHIRCDPLRISNRSTQIHTTVKSGDEEDFILPARYSRYSSNVDAMAWLPIVLYQVLPGMAFLRYHMFTSTNFALPRAMLVLSFMLAIWSIGCMLFGAWTSC